MRNDRFKNFNRQRDIAHSRTISVGGQRSLDRAYRGVVLGG